MSKILLIGNVIKDVYLAMDENANAFEIDETDTAWLDLAFDGRGYKFYERSSILGGVAVSVDVIQKMGLDAEVMAGIVKMDGGKATAENCDCEYRYILTHNDEICYLTSDERRPAKWEAPKDAIDWLYIGRSVSLTDDLLQKIKSFVSLSKNTRIAYYIGKNANKLEMELAKMANIVFCDNLELKLDTKAIVCEISEGEVAMGPLRMEWLPDRAGLRTHLTMYSTIAATIFSALLMGKTARDALLMAKLNVENSTLQEVLTSKKLEDLLKEVREKERNIEQMAESLVRRGKGILAADESGGSIHKKFVAADIPDDEEHRWDYRNILLTTKNLGWYVNGVILFDETVHQKTEAGQPFVEYLTEQGIIPGVKVDKGLVPMAADSEEVYTDGLDGLLLRLNDYYDMGLRFAKWRAAFTVKVENEKIVLPSEDAVVKNCEILARYAKACQIAGLVPIVEPEVVHDGDYSIEACAEATGRVLDTLFAELHRFDVDLSGCVLKCNMILPGKDYDVKSTTDEIGAKTAAVLKEHVPKDLAGVVFLSGGQSPEEATDNLQAVLKNGPFPWNVTFSFARALQEPALKAWGGEHKNTRRGQSALLDRLVANQKALS